MEYVTSSYEPKRVLEFFEQICQIPHGSGNEEKIADYLCDFAREHSLEYYRDSVNNVLIKKGASIGREYEAPIMLQGHMDMVCEKNSDCSHDFGKDPLDLYVKDGKLRARGTTLGGDDGIALAYMLEILEGKYSHPALECLITVGEETSMVGASAFDYGKVSSRRIINIDSEEEGTVTMSCAGGSDLHMDICGKMHSGKGRTLKIEVSGLAGGHSGVEINEGRANSIRVMGRILAAIYEDTPFNLCKIEGGNKRNAIPRECVSEIYVLDTERAKEIIAEQTKLIAKELGKLDRRFKVRVSKGGSDLQMFAYKESSAVINMILLPLNGVYSMYEGKERLVRSSSNMGIIKSEEGRVRLDVMARSSSESEMDHILLTFKRVAKAVGAEYELIDRHPGWELNPKSALAESYVRIYDMLYGRELGGAKKCAIHAGLECGIIISAVGEADAISIGPNIYDIHTPDEALDLASCERSFKVLVKMLEEV